MSTELTDGAQRQETAQKNLILATDKERIHRKEKKSLLEQLALCEKSKMELQKKLDIEITLRENKHKQLLSTIRLCHGYGILFFFFHFVTA